MVDIPCPILVQNGDECILQDTHGRQLRGSRYRYTLLTGGRRIRLLKAHTPVRLGMISPLDRYYELVDYDLEPTDIRYLDVSDSPYVALSYCWGSPNKDAALVIMVQGQRQILPVTSGAWEAIERTLPALGLLKGKYMWIDQVCINQGDIAEKQRQVQLMGEIYRRCWHCMIWLGPADDHTPDAYSLLHRLDQAISQYDDLQVVERHVADASHMQIRTMLAAETGSDRLPAITDPGWLCMARLLTRPWFRRLWTFQEAILCYKGDSSFRCGRHNVNYKTFTRASMFLGSQWGDGGPDFTGIDFGNARGSLSQIAALRDIVAQQRPTPLSFILNNNLNRDCANPSDRIYAFLGIQNEDGPALPIAVDYGRTPERLYADVARSIIRSQRSLRICANAPERLPEGGFRGLPSWAPDWTRPPITSAFEMLNPRQTYFRACQTRTHVDDGHDPAVLRTRGRIVDCITQIIDVEVLDAMNNAERLDLLTRTCLPLLTATLRSLHLHLTDGVLAHKIIKTITLNGYTSKMYQGDYGLPDNAWSQMVCSFMLDAIIAGTVPATIPSTAIRGAQWLEALTRQATQCANRRFALLKNSFLGLVPKAAKAGDNIAVLHGSSLPFVIRGTEQECTLIGVAFVDGIMYGESMDWTTGDTIYIC